MLAGTLASELPQVPPADPLALLLLGRDRARLATTGPSQGGTLGYAKSTGRRPGWRNS
jgi:hypothetical protein